MDRLNVHAVEGRVINWARWVSTESAAPQRCASAEGRYLPPAADDAKLEFLRSNPVDVLDAERIERGICLLPDAGRILLVLHYVKCLPPSRIVKRLRIPRNLYDAFRQRNLCDLAQRVEALDETKLIRRGKLIWAGLAK